MIDGIEGNLKVEFNNYINISFEQPLVNIALASIHVCPNLSIHINSLRLLLFLRERDFRR